MRPLRLLALGCLISFSTLQAQVCDPTMAPIGLQSSYTPGLGALLEWDAVPGSVGVQLSLDLPSGSSLNRRLLGFELSQFAIPDALLTDGSYSWRVQAACSAVPPFQVTPISASSSFLVGDSVCPALLSDVDGNLYNTVQIGDQCWMQDNLMVERFRNGDAITTGLNNSEWQSTTIPAFALYNNEPVNKIKLGILYNWFAATDARGLCPTGWHLPSDAEWTELTDFLGGEALAGGKMKTTGNRMDGTGVWFAPNVDATNSSGFSGLPGGFRDLNGIYGIGGFYAFWWSSTEENSLQSLYRQVGYVETQVTRSFDLKQYGFSVRCLKD
jgi:uncharacterized protein (TIGR02145 family)